MYALDAQSHENHAHYYQAASELNRRFGCVDIFADIGCRLGNVAAELNRHKLSESSEHRFLQSLLHGQSHSWCCLVCRGPPWVFDHGRFTGEESERVFSVLTKLSTSLAEMSLRKRTETLASYLWDMIESKTTGLSKALKKRYHKVRIDLSNNIQAYSELDGPPLSYDQFLLDLDAIRVSQGLLFLRGKLAHTIQ